MLDLPPLQAAVPLPHDHMITTGIAQDSQSQLAAQTATDIKRKLFGRGICKLDILFTRTRVYSVQPANRRVEQNHSF